MIFAEWRNVLAARAAPARLKGWMEVLICRSVAVMIFLVAVAYEVRGGTPVYRCVKNGQITLTDKPCEQSDPNAVVSPTQVPSSADLSPVGNWSGQIQFHGIENGQPSLAAQSVASTNLIFTTDGKVSGESQNRCKFLGVWSQGPTKTIFWLDLTLNSCQFPSLDRRFNGSFILARPDSSAAVQLQTFEMPHGSQGARTYDLKGTIRR